jgi:glycosyltransferase involved in cell wall biosynthesis
MNNAILIHYKITQIYSSKKIPYVAKIKQEYALSGYVDNKSPLLVCGLFKNNDVNILKKHKGKKFILWLYDNKITNYSDIFCRIKLIDIVEHFYLENEMRDILIKYKMINDIEISINKTIIIKKKKTPFLITNIATILEVYPKIYQMIDKFKGKNIVVTSTQYPGYGGAATNAYLIHQYLCANSINSVCVFFDDMTKDINIDQSNIGNIVLFPKEINMIEASHTINTMLGNEPDICLCKNWRSPFYMKKMYKHSNIIYLVSGSLHMSHLSNFEISSQKVISDLTESLSIKDPTIIKFPLNISKTIEKEVELINIVNQIWFNSKLSCEMFQLFHKKNTIRTFDIVNTSILSLININKKCNSWDKRFYDIGFISSKLDRRIKNYDFFRKIVNDDAIKKYNIIAIGNRAKGSDYSEKHITYCDLLNREDLHKKLNDIKILLVPSYFEASSNVLIEAKYLGCKTIVSKNVGNCHDFNIICNDVYCMSDWVSAILLLLN